MAPTTQPDLLSLDEFAAMLGVSRTTVEIWVREKAVASFKKGGVRKIAREDAARFVKLHTIKAKRPDWLTADVESEWRKVLREEIRNVMREERDLKAA